MAFEYPLGDDRHFDGIKLLEVIVKCDELIIEDCEVCVIAPDQVCPIS